jgi:hypothetical protein
VRVSETFIRFQNSLRVAQLSHSLLCDAGFGDMSSSIFSIAAQY